MTIPETLEFDHEGGRWRVVMDGDQTSIEVDRGPDATGGSAWTKALDGDLQKFPPLTRVLGLVARAGRERLPSTAPTEPATLTIKAADLLVGDVLDDGLRVLRVQPWESGGPGTNLPTRKGLDVMTTDGRGSLELDHELRVTRQGSAAPPDQDTADVLTAWTWLRAQPANDGSGVDLRVGADGRVRTHCEPAPPWNSAWTRSTEDAGDFDVCGEPMGGGDVVEPSPKGTAQALRILRLATYEKVWPSEIEDSIQLLAARYPVTADTVIEVIEEHGLAGAPTKIEALIRGEA